MTREHGTLACYVKGCKCEQCLAAKRRYEKQRNADIRRGNGPRTIDATGTRRRVEALSCMGWSRAHIARELGVDVRNVQRWALHPTVRVVTARKVAELYERWAMHSPTATTPHERGQLTWLKAIAAKNGWHPPLAWDEDTIDDPSAKPNYGERVPVHSSVDPVVVQRILDGDYSLADKATKAERIEVVARWRADGRSLKQLEAETGWRPDRYVTRTPAEVRRIIERSLAS